MDIDGAIEGVVSDIAKRYAKSVAINNQQLLIQDLGMTSMDIAELVAVLEGRLGADPFAENVSIASVRTVGDLKNAYRTCLK